MRRKSDVFSEVAGDPCASLVASAIFAFNSNIDLVKRTDAKGALEIARKAGLPRLAQCVNEGNGAEEVVTRDKLNMLLACGFDEKRIGGQAGNMANASAAMGMRTYMHAGVVSREIAQHLHADVMVPSPFCFQKATDIMSDGEAPTHFVVDFGADRYIASYDMHNTHMLINRNFKRCAEREIVLVDRAVISGFHLLDIPEPRGRIDEVKVLIKRWRSRNSRIRFHLELGDYHKPVVLGLVLESIAPDCNSIGMNEQELKASMAARGKKWRGAADALGEMQEFCKTVVLHTGDYAVVAGAEAKGAESRLAMGHLIAAFVAREGRPPSVDELADFEAGAARVAVKDKERKQFGRSFAFVPALRSVGEKTKLGLGDAFSMGFACSKAQ